MDSISIAPLKDKGYLVSDCKGKAEILVNQFQLVFTKDDSQDIPEVSSRVQEDIPHLKIGEDGATKLLCSIKIILESPYHLAAVSGAHFTQGTVLIVILVISGSAKSMTHQFALGGFRVKGMAWKTESMQNMDVYKFCMTQHVSLTSLTG